MKPMKDYHDLYLKCNVLLLADVFEKFKNRSLKIIDYVLSHYVSSPVLQWNAMLNMAKVEVKLTS